LAYIQGEARGQQALFPSTLDDLIPADHVCRVIEAWVAKLDLAAIGFARAEPAETGRAGDDPRDLLKLYRYGYLQQVRSSRRLEAECRRNVEVMWRLGRLTPDYKSSAEFRRVHRNAVTAAGATSRAGKGRVGGDGWLEVPRRKQRPEASGARGREALPRISWRTHIIRPSVVRLGREDRHLALSGGADTGAPATLAEGRVRYVRRGGAGVWRLRDEKSLHQHVAAFDYAPSA
jgi:transposase